MTVSPRARVRVLTRSGRVDPGLFAPLVLAQAAEVEALPLEEFLTNPTKLAKGLTALHRALDAETVVTAAADGLLAEAAGAGLDWSVYPPEVATHPAAGGALPAGLAERMGDHPRVAAAVEATSRLAATLPGEPALVSALTGPATLAAQLGGPWFAEAAGAEDEAAGALVEAAGALVLAVARRFLEAGTQLAVLVEAEPPPPAVLVAWRSAVVPLANVARFHQAAPVVVFESFSPQGAGAVPVAVGVCAPEGAGVPGPATRLRGVALPCEPKEWGDRRPGAPLAVTAGAVPGGCGFAEVLAAYRRVQGR